VDRPTIPATFSGGKASNTKRGINLKQFIQRDTVKAEIEIHLWNGGDDAYKTNIFQHANPLWKAQQHVPLLPKPDRQEQPRGTWLPCQYLYIICRNNLNSQPNCKPNRNIFATKIIWNNYS
jgi:hypothetical protein